MAVDWLVELRRPRRAETGWEPRTIDLGGGLGVRHVDDEPEPAVGEFVALASRRVRARARPRGLAGRG